VLEADVGPVDVVPHRQAGLEHHHRGGRIGQHHPVELDAHPAVRAQRVDPRVRVTRVHEHLLVLLEPGVQRGPLEADGALQALDRRIGDQPGRPRPVRLADPQPVQFSQPSPGLLGVLLGKAGRGGASSSGM
jgi:hypothetical protein